MDWDKLDEIHKSLSYERPEDSFTIQEYAERYDMSYSGATKRLRNLAEKGLVEKHWRKGQKAYYTLIE